MREILFRGKRKDSGAWVYGHLHKMDGYGTGYTEYGIQVQDISTSRPWSVVLIPETIGQYTGLTDKNGNKVFEGDIVKIDDKYICYVVYSGVATGFVVMLYIDRQTSHFSDYLGNDYDNYKRTIEVIGNIHDNHDLLEVTQ